MEQIMNEQFEEVTPTEILRCAIKNREYFYLLLILIYSCLWFPLLMFSVLLDNYDKAT